MCVPCAIFDGEVGVEFSRKYVLSVALAHWFVSEVNGPMTTTVDGVVFVRHRGFVPAYHDFLVVSYGHSLLQAVQ